LIYYLLEYIWRIYVAKYIFEKMRLIQRFINRWIRNELDDKKVLGRWNIDYCDKRLNKKVDLSNEDHCGPCGQYILDKPVEIKVEVKNI